MLFLKMKFLFTILFFFIVNTGNSQNLVPNPSFEDYDSCPHYPDQIYCTYLWFQPGIGTSDYYNTCDTIHLPNPPYLPQVGVPFNWAGFQNARTGVAYAGFTVYADSSWNLPNYKEYIEIKLTDSLQAGKKYCVQFYVSLCDSSSYATDDISAYFSKDSIISGNYYPFPIIPQISNPTGNIISDTLNWSLISGEFIAEGGEKWLTLGSFKNDTNITIAIASPIINWYGISYFYIDDVSVIKCDTGNGIGEINKTEFVKIYSTSSEGIFTVEINNIYTSFIYVYNAMGQVVFTDSEMKKNSFSLDLSNQTSGIYFISVGLKDKIITQKIFLSQ